MSEEERWSKERLLAEVMRQGKAGDDEWHSGINSILIGGFVVFFNVVSQLYGPYLSGGITIFLWLFAIFMIIFGVSRFYSASGHWKEQHRLQSKL